MVLELIEIVTILMQDPHFFLIHIRVSAHALLELIDTSLVAKSSLDLIEGMFWVIEAQDADCFILGKSQTINVIKALVDELFHGVWV